MNTKLIINFRLINLLFCFAFFNQNSININIIKNSQKYLRPVEGRGSAHIININKKKIKIIDESYNANPDTMYQAIEYLNAINKINTKKILILGNMNELGKNSHKMHQDLLNQIENFSFKFVILCGEFYQRSIKKLNNTRNEFIYIENKKKIMNFLKENVHNNDIILIKCSNSTEINKFTKNLLQKR